MKLNATEQNIQEINDQTNEIQKTRGFMKSPRWVEQELFGPNSPLPDKWRVFNFIKYRIQDNKRSAEAEFMTREYIIRNTGIRASNFDRIIKSLEKNRLIHVGRRNYRDAVSIYSLNKSRFNASVISADHKKPISVIVDNSKVLVDNFANNENPNFKMKFQGDSKLQNEVTKLQNEVEPVVTTSESLGNSSLRALSLDPLKINLRSLEGEKSENGDKDSPSQPESGPGTGIIVKETEEQINQRLTNQKRISEIMTESLGVSKSSRVRFHTYSDKSSDEIEYENTRKRKEQLIWFRETNGGEIPYDKWKADRLVCQSG